MSLVVVGGCRAFDDDNALRGYASPHLPAAMRAEPVGAQLPAFFGLETPEPLQQFRGTCYSYAFVQFLRMLSVRDGIVLPKPSAAWFVFYSLLVDTGGDVTAALARGSSWGSYTRSTLLAAQLYGIASEHDWPSTPENHDTAPPWHLRVNADDRRLRLRGLVNCSSVDAIANALVMLRSPVMVSLPTHSEVLHNDGSTVLTGAGYALGGHVWNIVSYRTDDNGNRIWGGLTSWGACGIAGRGVFEMSEEYLRRAFDCWACEQLAFFGGV